MSLFSRKRCCCEPSDEPTWTCPGCAIPLVDLTLFLQNTLIGNATIPLPWNAGLNEWRSACHNQMRFRLTCSTVFGTTGLSFYADTFTGAPCPGGSVSGCRSPSPGAPTNLAPDPANTCSPVYLRYTLSSGGCPSLYSQGYRAFTVTL